MIRKLTPEELRKKCELSLSCQTTDEIAPLEEIVGQERAVRALKFGLDIKARGFNVYVSGYPGTGRTTAVKDFLEEIAKKKTPPSDWCYVNNFSNTYEPKAIRLPAGHGKIFQKDMQDLINAIQTELPKAFKSEDYASKREATIEAINEKRNQLVSELNKKAGEQGFLIQSTPIGVATIPLVKGRPINDQAFLNLDPKIREDIQRKREKLNADLRTAMRQLRDLEGKARDEIEKLNQEVALYAIGHLILSLKEKHGGFSEILSYVDAAQNDILENLEQFITPQEQKSTPFPWMKENQYNKYQVNVIIDNSDLKGAPVVLELNPTYQNLFGRIEKEAQFGILTTDFSMIHAGSLHKANGGYLVIHAEQLLQNPFSWESLKMTLKSDQIKIEEASERFGLMTTKGLRPQPIPEDVKIVLIGNPVLHMLLYAYDMDFKELFKVKADFDTTMERTEENMRKYAAFICTCCRKEDLKHLEASAVAKIVEYGQRLAEDQEKLSARFAQIADIIREASFYAGQDNSEYISASHIEKAIEERIYRSNLIQEKIQEMIRRRFFIIDTEGKATGQVNGLSVIGMGDFSFGRPSRVTASIGVGREGIIDIEREAMLGGPIHTKGVMILGGYLADKYAGDKPLSLTARLVFEQSYEGVEGDSASSTELYAILSALSNLPINQIIAVTGSVNQKGEVQAIGGVNEKIEGYYEVCKAQGLTGRQGVMIPESNMQNLMLKEEVVEAVRDGKFHIYTVKNIDEGIEVLTGVKAGEKLEDGTFEKDTVNYKVDKRLRIMAEKFREFSTSTTKT